LASNKTSDRGRSTKRPPQRKARNQRQAAEPAAPPAHRQIIVNERPEETRIAILEDHRLVELLVERESEERILGNIYKGKVTSVLPGMQAAFIDIGLDKNAFLHFSDVCPSLPDPDTDFGEEGPEVPEQPPESISDLLQKGQEIVVQITKEAIQSKGPRVTTHVSVAGRCLVLMPGVAQVGVSKKIETREERSRVKAILEEVVEMDGFGFIVRTAARGKTKDEFAADATHLTKVWKRLCAEAEKQSAPACLRRELTLTSGLVRDFFTSDVDALVVDSTERFERIAAYLEDFAPDLRGKLEHYDAEIPIFDCYDVERELEASLQREVPLPHGGYIGIDHTEALLAIDVNTGRYTGRRDPEETILRTNLDAAREIPRQLRLRDIGGIIVIDFIDMEADENRQKVLRELRAHLQRDRSRTKTLKVSEIGLVEMTRKRVGPSLLQRFSEVCPCCAGQGRLLSRETVARRVEQALTRAAVYLYESDLALWAHPRLIAYLKTEHKASLRDLRKRRGISLSFHGSEKLGLTDYQVVSRETGRDLTEKIWA